MGNEAQFDPNRNDEVANPPLDGRRLEYLAGLLSDEVVQRLQSVDAQTASIPIARAALQRIRDLWIMLFGNPWFSLRYDGFDEVIYQNLRRGLLAQLDRSPQYADAKLNALDTLPDILPTDSDLTLFDEEIRQHYDSEFQRLDALLIQLALAEDVNPDPRNVDALFVTHDDYLRQLRDLVAKDSNTAQKQFAHPLPAQPRIPAKPHRSKPTGRRKVPLPYEAAQTAWWDMSDEMLRPPTQAEFCDRLTELGYPMSARTLRERIRKWRHQGLDWDPPRPNEEL